MVLGVPLIAWVPARRRSMTEDFELTERANNWIEGLKSYYYGKPLEAVHETATPAAGAFKIL